MSNYFSDFRNRPSLKTGFARSAGNSAWPDLFPDRGAWIPMMGYQGNSLHDFSGRGAHGALTNMDVATDWIMSPVGQALELDNSNDEVLLTNYDLLAFDKQTVFIVCRPSTTSGPNTIFVQGGTSEGIDIYYRTSPRQFSFHTYQGSTGVEVKANVLTASVIENGIWCTVGCVYDQGAMKIYVNGRLDNTGSNGTSIGAQATTASIGRSGDWANGAFAAVMIFRQALNDNQIRSLHVNPLAGLQPLDIPLGIEVAGGGGGGGRIAEKLAGYGGLGGPGGLAGVGGGLAV